MDTFFGLDWPASEVLGMTLTLALSVALSGLIGLERELHGHPAGLRTHILVCVGSTLLTLVSIHIGHAKSSSADPGRIAAQIVSGIGFLGAGAIIRDGSTIKGLTTAASIWATAAIGIALGAGPFYAEIGVITTAIVLFTLWVLNLMEDWLARLVGAEVAVEVAFQARATAAAEILGRMAGLGLQITSVEILQDAAGQEQTVRLGARAGKGFDRHALIPEASRWPGVVRVRLR